MESPAIFMRPRYEAAGLPARMPSLNVAGAMTTLYEGW
jgi:hypothetical protein